MNQFFLSRFLGQSDGAGGGRGEGANLFKASMHQLNYPPGEKGTPYSLSPLTCWP